MEVIALKSKCYAFRNENDSDASVTKCKGVGKRRVEDFKWILIDSA